MRDHRKWFPPLGQGVGGRVAEQRPPAWLVSVLRSGSSDADGGEGPLSSGGDRNSLGTEGTAVCTSICVSFIPCPFAAESYGEPAGVAAPHNRGRWAEAGDIRLLTGTAGARGSGVQPQTPGSAPTRQHLAPGQPQLVGGPLSSWDLVWVAPIKSHCPSRPG